MRRTKKFIAVTLACLMMTSFAVINVNAAEVSSLGDVQISPAANCPQHNIATKYITSFISGTATHTYQDGPCTITTTGYVYADYCTLCGTVFGNFIVYTDSHSAH